jgi:hypothetical protein
MTMLLFSVHHSSCEPGAVNLGEASARVKRENDIPNDIICIYPLVVLTNSKIHIAR